MEHHLIAFSVFDLSIEILRKLQTPIYMLFESNGTLFQEKIYSNIHKYISVYTVVNSFLIAPLVFTFTRSDMMLVKVPSTNKQYI